MKQVNEDVRNAAKQAGIKLWMVGEAMSLADCNFSRKLRHELPQTEKEKIFGIIEKLAREREGGA